MGKGFDYIIVGAGSAGCVLANRLSADPAIRVLLLEAGGRDWNPLIRIPLMTRLLYRMTSINWGYDTEPQPGLDNRSIHWPRGRVLGGSSAINGMVYVRGHPRDYDQWRQMGLAGWGFDDVLPYFRRSERHAFLGAPFHGTDGPLPITRPEFYGPLGAIFVEAGKQAGIPETDDFNNDRQEGVGRHHFNIAGGQRMSTAEAFLKPVRARPNLTVWTRADVIRLVIERGRATGVAFTGSAGEETVRAEREIILAGGAVNSPVLLLRSGIGPADELRALGIKVLADRRDVGRHLQDHLGVYVSYQCTIPASFNRLLRPDRAALAIGRAMVLRSGPGTLMPSQGCAFVRPGPGAEIPDLQVTFMPGLLNRLWGGWRDEGYLIHVLQLRPDSRGSIRLRSADPAAKPVIDPGYLTMPGDLVALREGIRVAREIGGQRAFDGARGKELAPSADIKSPAALDAWIRANATTAFHPVGTCRMGADDDAVVDAGLRVREIGGLRIADASVMPTLIGGNTNAPTIMIAEKAADMILAA